VQCGSIDPDNLHYYEVIPFGDQAWDLADADAGTRFFTPPGEDNALQGHLATITSAAENACVNDIRLNRTVPFVGGQLWLGGSQAPNSTEPGDGWSWVNNEGVIPGTNSDPNDYANWLFGEPNDQGGVENHLTIGIRPNGEWNDSIPGVGAIGGYVIEYDGTVPADLCVDDGSPLPPSCNPAGVQESTFPESIIVPPGSTYSQTILEIPDGSGGTLGAKVRDPRVNDKGECWDRRRLDVFLEFPGLGGALGGDPGDLILGRFDCGSPDFAVLKSTANGFDIQNDVIRSRQLPEEIFGDETFACDGVYAPGDIPVGEEAAYADLQRRGTFNWQPDNKRAVAERRELNLTNGCGSRRGAHADLSYFILNLHQDCGLPFGMYPNAVRQCFRTLTQGKFERLQQSLRQARREGLITRSQFRSFNRTVARAQIKFTFANYNGAIVDVSDFIAQVNAADLAASTNNREGNLLMRAEHIEFSIIQIRDDAAPPAVP
jgi:hypothetical protein